MNKKYLCCVYDSTNPANVLAWIENEAEDGYDARMKAAGAFQTAHPDEKCNWKVSAVEA